MSAGYDTSNDFGMSDDGYDMSAGYDTSNDFGMSDDGYDMSAGYDTSNDFGISQDYKSDYPSPKNEYYQCQKGELEGIVVGSVEFCDQDLRGPQGPAGAQGPKGDTGNTGPQDRQAEVQRSAGQRSDQGAHTGANQEPRTIQEHQVQHGQDQVQIQEIPGAHRSNQVQRRIRSTQENQVQRRTRAKENQEHKESTRSNTGEQVQRRQPGANG